MGHGAVAVVTGHVGRQLYPAVSDGERSTGVSDDFPVRDAICWDG